MISDDDDDLGKALTEHFAKAAKSAVADLHAKGLSAYGEVDGVWCEIPPPWHETPLLGSLKPHELLEALHDPVTHSDERVVSRTPIKPGAIERVDRALELGRRCRKLRQMFAGVFKKS